MMNQSIIRMAACLLAAAMLTACSSESDEMMGSDIPQPLTGKKVILRCTMESSTTESSSTTRFAPQGFGGWEFGDRIAVRYQRTDGSWAKATAITNPEIYNDHYHYFLGNSANFIAELTDPISGSVQFIYPDRRYQDEAPYYDTTGLLTKQEGTFEDIGRNWFISTGSAMMTVNGDEATLGQEVQLEPQITLLHLDTYEPGGYTLPITKLDISDGTNCYSITRKQPDPLGNFSGGVREYEFIVALKPVSNARLTFSGVSTETAKVFTKQDVTLWTCTSDNVGDVFDKDGNIYRVSDGSGYTIYTNSFDNITLEKGKYYLGQRLHLVPNYNPVPVALIAYVGEPGSVDDSNMSPEYGFRGLAIAMRDCSNCNSNYGPPPYDKWCDLASGTCTSGKGESSLNGIRMTEELVSSSGTNGHKHYTAMAAVSYKYDVFNPLAPLPAGTSDWFLPSAEQWMLIIPQNISGFLNSAGGFPITDGWEYASSTEESSSSYIGLNVSNQYSMPSRYKTIGDNIRSFLAFGNLPFSPFSDDVGRQDYEFNTNGLFQ